MAVETRPAPGVHREATDCVYPSDHWANDPDPESALAKAFDLGESLFNQEEGKLLVSLLPSDMRGLRVLDYGCGCGGWSVFCAKRGATVVGIDASECAVGAARRFAEKEGLADRCTFVAGCNMPESRYDLVLVKDVIEHIEDDEGWLRDVSRMLAPNGIVVIATQNKRSLNYLIEGSYHRVWRQNRAWMGWDPTHVRFYTPASLRRVVETCGLRVERWASMYLIPYDILSWFLLLKADIKLPWVRYIDYWLGKIPPFNRLGWELMAVCRKAAQ